MTNSNRTIMEYEVTFIHNGVERTTVLDDTYPTVYDWLSAVSLVARAYADGFEFLTIKEYPSKQYSGIGYIHECPMQLM